jgi:hypothetical protein
MTLFRRGGDWKILGNVSLGFKSLDLPVHVLMIIFKFVVKVRKAGHRHSRHCEISDTKIWMALRMVKRQRGWRLQQNQEHDLMRLRKELEHKVIQRQSENWSTALRAIRTFLNGDGLPQTSTIQLTDSQWREMQRIVRQLHLIVEKNGDLISIACLDRPCSI